MKLSGSYKLDANKEVVWKALNDPNILKKCIPGSQSNAFLSNMRMCYQTHLN